MTAATAASREPPTACALLPPPRRRTPTPRGTPAGRHGTAGAGRDPHPGSNGLGGALHMRPGGALPLGTTVDAAPGGAPQPEVPIAECRTPGDCSLFADSGVLRKLRN